MAKRDPISRQLSGLRKILGIPRDEEWCKPKVDIERSRRMTARIRAKLRSLSPDISEEPLTAFSVDVVDLLEVGEAHHYFLKQLLSLKPPRDDRRLESLLITWVDVELLLHANWHLNSLKKVMPKIYRKLEAGEKKAKRSTRKVSRR